MVVCHAACNPVIAAEFSGYATLTTDYVWRGVTQSNGDAAVQFAGDVAFANGIYTGIWISTVDIQNPPDNERDLQVNYYLGYGHDVSDAWRLGVHAVFYTYPGSTGSFDYSYEEFAFTANYDDRIWLEYSYSPDLYHSGYDTHNFEIYGETFLGKHLIIGGGAGYYDVSALAGEGYAYWQLGVTWPAGRFELDLRYHDTNDWVPIISSPDRAGARGALSLRFSF